MVFYLILCIQNKLLIFINVLIVNINSDANQQLNNYKVRVKFWSSLLDNFCHLAYFGVVACLFEFIK